MVFYFFIVKRLYFLNAYSMYLLQYDQIWNVPVCGYILSFQLKSIFVLSRFKKLKKQKKLFIWLHIKYENCDLRVSSLFHILLRFVSYMHRQIVLFYSLRTKTSSKTGRQT